MSHDFNVAQGITSKIRDRVGVSIIAGAIRCWRRPSKIACTGDRSATNWDELADYNKRRTQFMDAREWVACLVPARRGVPYLPRFPGELRQ